MIKLMQLQQRRQLEGLEEFSQFCLRENSLFTSNVYRQFSELGYQAMAKGALAAQWLQDDLNSLSSSASRHQLQVFLTTVTQHRDMVSKQLRSLLSIIIALCLLFDFTIRALGLRRQAHVPP